MNDFFAFLYEAGQAFHLGDFSFQLFTRMLYVPVGLILIISVFIGMLVFYYLIDHPRFNKLTHWLLYVFIISIINFAAAFYITYVDLDILYTRSDMELPFWSEFWIFSTINLAYSLILSVIVSFAIRWWSNNCSTCPIPN